MSLPDLTFVQSGNGETTCLAVFGDIDLSNRESLIGHALRALEESTTLLRLDLSGVPFCDSSGVSGLLAIYRIASGDGKRMVIVNPSEHLERVLTVAGLYDSLTGQEPGDGRAGLVLRPAVPLRDVHEG